MTLSDLQQQLSSMPLKTGRQASSYICGINTYKSLMKNFGEFVAIPEHAIFMGVQIYPSPWAPDDGRFYPADYLESQQFTRYKYAD